MKFTKKHRKHEMGNGSIIWFDYRITKKWVLEKDGSIYGHFYDFYTAKFQSCFI